MEETRSAGVIIFLDTSNEKSFLLLKYPAGHWDFVKGKIEPGETSMQAAIRETNEETGIKDLDFLKKFEESIEYYFKMDGNSIHKKVLFFLAKTKTREVKISHEHLSFQWLNFEDAQKKITFQNAQKVLVNAQNLLKKTQ